MTTAPPARLARFQIEPAGEVFTLHIETETGERLVLTATPDQLDILADAIDDALLHDEAGDG